VCSFNQITLHSSRLEVLEAKFDSLSFDLAAAQLKIMNAISANALLTEEETRIEKDFDSHPGTAIFTIAFTRPASSRYS